MAYWVTVLQDARKGDKEAAEMLRQENEVRRELKLPTVEEELREFLDKK